MPVITPSGSSRGAADEFSLDSWDLCRDFVEEMVSGARATAERERPEEPIPDVDWTKIRRAGDGSSSNEGAIGRIVRVAAEVAHHIAGGTVEVPAPSAGRHAVALKEDRDEPDPEPPTVAATAAVAAITVVEPSVEPVTEQVLVDTSDSEAPTPQVEMAEGDAPEGAAKKRRTAYRTGWITVYTWMCMAGAIILLFVGWQLWGTSISQHHAQDQLKSQFEAAVKSHHPPKATKSGAALISAGENLPNPPDGTVIAHLQVPAIGLDEYVVSGSNASDLSKGPGHYVGTAMPGQAGNVAIAGHRTTNGAPFNRIGQLVPGDKVFLTTLSGEHLTYVVSAAPVSVSPRDVSVLNYFGDNRITLTTCTPEFSAAQRLIVVGQLEGSAAATPPAKGVTYHVANSANASWNWSLLPTVGIEVCLLLLLGLSYRRFGYWFEKTGKWIVLVPLWIAGLYLLFDTLTKFFPASL